MQPLLVQRIPIETLAAEYTQLHQQGEINKRHNHITASGYPVAFANNVCVVDDNWARSGLIVGKYPG